ncbi:MAG: SDR family NAD(P)-dependent oxidoreductase [Bacteroidota bacterium]
MKVSGHCILITGASRGIGKAMVKKMLELDNEVLALGRNPANLEKLKSEFPQIIPYTCDLENETNLRKVAEEIQQKHPQLSVLVNNAGIQHRYSFLEDPEALDKIKSEFQVNLLAPVLLTTLLLPTLARQTEAAVINVSSGLALAPKGNAPIYCSSKAGLHSYSKGLRYQLEKTPVRVFELLPPMVDTDMTAGRGKKKMSPEALVDELIGNLKRNRWETNAGVVKYLQLVLRLAPGLAYNIVKNRK